ncbi:hypothetical protein LOTGIDRAFT_158544 [Lottia gigantea]|uniref:G-protein coupled receptors family 1 profile domain-containing protein n=1 Tax=Lottia gigantea TaxID=225164 RepID=V4CC56_LOTGI|nr:hypothetical protein LOTGIDRAFT_158544 [Lottia gigantea]ESO99459.1 hypothetical protein LOTGIDRAFT_158544 [Lottia gigantea]
MAANATVSFHAGDVQKYLNLFIGVLTVTLALFSWLLILKGRSMSKRQKVCFCALLLTDTLLGLQVVIIRLIPFDYNSDHIICFLRLYLGLVLNVLTCLSSVLMTAERFFVMYKPLTFNRHITWQRLAYCIVMFWIFAVCLIFGLFHKGFGGQAVCQFWTCGDINGYIVVSVLDLTCYIIVLCMYAYIVKVTRRHFRMIAATMIGDVVAENVHKLTKKGHRTNITVGIIIFAFGISYIPMNSYSFYYALAFTQEERINIESTNQTFTILLGLFLINSLVNPIVYIWRLKRCRQEIVNWLLCRLVTIDETTTTQLES